MTETLTQLIGQTIDSDIAQKDLEKMANKAGYSRCQLRENGYMYDCQFDTTRLQIHVDDKKKILALKEG